MKENYHGIIQQKESDLENQRHQKEIEYIYDSKIVHEKMYYFSFITNTGWRLIFNNITIPINDGLLEFHKATFIGGIKDENSKILGLIMEAILKNNPSVDEVKSILNYKLNHHPFVMVRTKYQNGLESILFDMLNNETITNNIERLIKYYIKNHI